MAITFNDNGYAVRLNVPLQTVTNASTISSAGSSFNSSTNSGHPFINIPNTAITGTTNWKLTWDMPPLPYQIGNANNNAPRGYQPTDVTIAYAVSSGSLNSTNNDSTATLAAFVLPSSGFTDGSSISSDATAYGGTWTYAWGSSAALSSMGSSASSNLYVVVCSPAAGTNTVLNTDNQRLVFEWTWNSGSTNYGKTIHGITHHGKLTLGG